METTERKCECVLLSEGGKSGSRRHMTRIQSHDTLRKAKQGGDPLEADQRVAVPKEGEVNRQSAKECWASQTGLHDAVHTLKLPLSVCQNPNKGQSSG